MGWAKGCGEGKKWKRGKGRRQRQRVWRKKHAYTSNRGGWQCRRVQMLRQAKSFEEVLLVQGHGLPQLQQDRAPEDHVLRREERQWWAAPAEGPAGACEAGTCGEGQVEVPQMPHHKCRPEHQEVRKRKLFWNHSEGPLVQRCGHGQAGTPEKHGCCDRPCRSREGQTRARQNEERHSRAQGPHRWHQETQQGEYRRGKRDTNRSDGDTFGEDGSQHQGSRQHSSTEREKREIAPGRSRTTKRG